MSNPAKECMEGTIVLVEHEWYVDVVVGGQTQRHKVSQEDAWNHDIERGLVVIVAFSGVVYAGIVKRKRGNKKFVKIGTDGK